MSSWTYDPANRAIVVDGEPTALTSSEAGAFAYLWDHRGEVVSRTTLERDVWGLRPGVKSETVPVTIRNIRSKLPEAIRDALQTVRGVGWKLVAPAPVATMPRFGSPWFDRRGELAAVNQLFEDGWRVLTVTGPGGAGKTRLAIEFAEQLHLHVCFVDLEPIAEPADVERALITAAGMGGDDVRALERAFRGRKVVFLLDGCDRLIEAIQALVDQMPGFRFVLTSRTALGHGDEGVHLVSPMNEAEWRAFARLRFAATRWKHQADDATLEALRGQLDGLPLAVEALAASPQAPNLVLQRLEQQKYDAVRTSSLWNTLTATVQALDEADLDTLRSLAVVESPVDNATLTAWLGAEAPVRVADLAERSLVTRVNDGWRLLRTVRAVIRDGDPQGTERRRQLDDWLHKRCRRAGYELLVDPVPELHSLLPLVTDLLACLRSGPVAYVPDLLGTLTMLSLLAGPLELHRQALQLARKRDRSAPLVRMFSGIFGVQGAVEDFGAAFAQAGPADRIRTLLLLGASWFPRQVEVPSLPTSSDIEVQQLEIEMLQLPRAQDLDATFWDLSERAGEQRLLRMLIQVVYAQALSARGRKTDALTEWEQILPRADDMLGLSLLCRNGHCDALLEVDREQAHLRLVDTAEMSLAWGFGMGWVVGRIGLLLYLLDDTGRACELFEHAASGRHLATRRACGHLLLAARTRLGLSDAEPPHGFDGITGTMNDGTPLLWITQAIVLTEFDFRDGAHEAILERLATAPDTQLGRLWSRSVRARLPS